jgi:hypothetical protein
MTAKKANEMTMLARAPHKRWVELLDGIYYRAESGYTTYAPRFPVSETHRRELEKLGYRVENCDLSGWKITWGEDV